MNNDEFFVGLFTGVWFSSLVWIVVAVFGNLCR